MSPSMWRDEYEAQLEAQARAKRAEDIEAERQRIRAQRHQGQQMREKITEQIREMLPAPGTNVAWWGRLKHWVEANPYQPDAWDERYAEFTAFLAREAEEAEEARQQQLGRHRRRRPRTEEEKRQARERQQQAWQDPEKRERLLQGVRQGHETRRAYLAARREWEARERGPY